MAWDGGPPPDPPAVLSPYAARIAGLAPPPMPARDFTAEERATLAATMDRYTAAVRDGDGQSLIDVLPPEILPAAAKAMGCDVAELPSRISELMRDAAAAGVVTTIDFDLSQVRVESMPDGTPYAVAPTHDVATKPNGGKPSNSTYNTLAVRQGETWRLYSLNGDLSIAILQRELPAFGAIDLYPTPSRTKL